jgi:transcriptional regulator with XRE-family HTH domain
MNTKVGVKIKKLRKKKGLSQEQVADYLHVSQSTYARIENGESATWANYIKPISELFDIPPEELIKQDSIIINSNQQGRESNNAETINQLSEKLITQFEKRIADKEAMIQLLQKTNNGLLELVERLKR